MKKIIHTLFYLTLLMLPLTGQAEFLMIEDAIESESLQININDSLDGYVITRQCSTCPKLRFTIDKTTQAVKRGKVIHLHQANQLNGKFATIIFDPKTKLVKRIIW